MLWTNHTPPKRRPGVFSSTWRGVTLPVLGILYAAAGWLLSLWAPRHPDTVERIYSGGIYPVIAKTVSFLTGWLPFSLAEMILLLSPILIGLIVWRIMRKHRLRRASWIVCAARALLALMGIAAVLFGAFETGWALNYHRQPYAITAGLELAPRSSGDLADLCRELTLRANQLRADLPEDSDGVFAARQGDLRASVGPAYALAGADAPWLSGSYRNPKPVMLSPSMSWAGISGIFTPITYEANVNVDQPPLLIGSAAAHEAAHLRGFAREDEANFISYFVCCRSQDPSLAYSGVMLGLIEAGNALSSADPTAYAEVYALRSEALLRDIGDYNAYWKGFEGPVREAHSKMNDAYLKANRQEDGVRSYGRMVDLMLAEHRSGLFQ